LKEEALDRIKWRNRFGRGCGPVVWQITDDDDDVKANQITHFLSKPSMRVRRAFDGTGIHFEFCLTTGPLPLPQRVVHTVRCRKT
jgi:hypothetical protein